MTTDNNPQLGVLAYGEDSTRRTDYLYRISLKCFIGNAQGEVLVVKETGRNWWDLPGGGMDHGETIATAIAREMKEEVNLEGNFTYKIIAVDDPGILKAQNIWQLRLVFAVTPAKLVFSPGDEGDETAFIKPETFKASAVTEERRIYEYAIL